MFHSNNNNTRPPTNMTTTTTTISEQQQGPTPKGWNKNRRDICKVLLLFTCIQLLGNQPIGATVTSSASVLCIKEGTFWSTKNLKWLILSVISFGSSLMSYILVRGYHDMDDDKASHGVSFALFFMAKSIQTFWGVTLGMFLFSAFTSPQAATSAVLTGKPPSPSSVLQNNNTTSAPRVGTTVY
mmetsp:Transcript_16735/g.23619  ORF Transcript_16735/g.23619 Transcript_16735/m.23619 type:complete len:184 (-) Transcript_16735:73-624(-)